MASRFQDKFNEDLELILAKYSNPFNGAPELTLSTCDWPENVQVIENYKYSNCGKWKVLGTDSNGIHSCDEGNDETSDGDYLYSSDEENQTSCYDSDDPSDCSESLKIGTSFREKYPRSCAKQGLKTPPFNGKLKESTNGAKTPPSNHKLAYKQYYYEQNKEQASRITYTNDEYFKPKETVTITKDLWSQVQQCLRLMTNVFSQLNCKSDNEKDSKKRHSHSIRKCSVKQRLFHDTNTSSVPQGMVVEKLFVRHKRSSAPAVELASRQTFISDTKSKISEIESLDSGFGQEDNVSASTQQYSSLSSSKMGGSTSHKTIVSQKSEGRSCAESSRLKTSVPNSLIKSAAGSKQLSSGVSCSDSLSCLQPSTELSPKVFDEHNRESEKKRRRRYRLVRRRSTSCRTRARLSNETSTSEHESDARENQHFVKSEFYPCTPTETSENESDIKELRQVAKNEHSFDQCLSDTEDFHIPEKTKMAAVKAIKQNECCSSSEKYHRATSGVYDKVLSPRAIPRKKTLSLHTSSQENCHSPTSHMHTQTRSLIPELSQGYCHSSTPRKHIRRTNAVNSPEAYLKSPFFQQDSGTSAESMPSPIRSTLNTNEALINNTFLDNTNHQTQSSQPPRNKESLPSPMRSKMPGTIFQPEISVKILTTKDILKKRSSCNERPTESNIRSGQNDGYTKKLFPNKSKKGFPANTLQSHIPSDNLSKQSTEQDYVSNKGDNQPENLMPSIIRSSTSTKSPVVRTCRTEPFSEPDCCRSKSRNVLRATTNKRAVNYALTQTDNSESSTSTESSITRCERKPEVRTPEKLISRNSGSFTTPNNKQLKIPPRRVKFHPYSTCGKFPRTPSLISPLRDLTIESPRHKWSTLDRSPMAVCVKQARRMPDPVVASRTILEFGSHDQCSDSSDKEKKKCRDEREPGEIRNEHSLQYRRKKMTMKRNNEVNCHVEDNESKCSNGKCTKIFCFNCSMMDLS